MPKLYYDTVEIGDPVTPLTKPPVTRVQIAKFAGAARDYSPLHIDDDFAKAAGYGGVFAHGGIALGFATEAVAKWLENGRVLVAHGRFQRLVWPGDILTAKGVVVDRHDHSGEPRIDVDVWAENQNHDIVMKGQITCVLWRDEKEEKKGKGVWPPAIPKSAEKLRAEREATEAARAEGEERPEEATPDEKPARKPAKPAPAKAAAPAKPAPAKPAPAKPAPKPAPAKAAAPPKPKTAEKAKKAAAKKAAPKPAAKAKPAAKPKKAAPPAKKKAAPKTAAKAKASAAAKKTKAKAKRR
jgi:acyl dehydratase